MDVTASAQFSTPPRIALKVDVDTLHAELEGMALLPAFEQLLSAWRGAGIELTSLGAFLAAMDAAGLPRHRTAIGTIAGRSGTVALQGPEFLPRSQRACA